MDTGEDITSEDARVDLTDQTVCAEVVMPNWVGTGWLYKYSTASIWKACNQNLHDGNGKDMMSVSVG
jgi:hypothetical protein